MRGVAGAVLVVAAGGTVLGLWLTGPSWPHPWCGQVMSTLYSNGQTYGQFTNALQFEENDGAPTGNLISDETSLAQDEQAESTDNVTQGFQDLAAAQTDMSAVSSDARAINTACGKPAGWQSGKLNVPPSS